MTSRGDVLACVEELTRIPFGSEQDKLRAEIRKRDDYSKILLAVCGRNPFFVPDDEDLRILRGMNATHGVTDLIASKAEAVRSTSPKTVVFCMPKSGSSFVQSALQHAMQLPFVSLTGFAPGDISSFYGMNGREQELDELAIIKSILSSPTGFVAQHHTRCTMYLALQVQMFKLTPIVTVRNVLDSIVSFDRMMLEWRSAGQDPWGGDSPFSIPAGYPELDEATRLRLLSWNLGVWLINFFLSWKRCANRKFASPIVLQYELDIIDPARFVRRLTQALSLNEAQQARLAAYAQNPDKDRSRFRVGKAGLGAEKVPQDAQTFLRDYAGAFREELSANELNYLI